MRKTVLVLASLLLLTSCIDVEDFNTPYFAEHVATDGKLIGKWRPVYQKAPGAPLVESGIPTAITEKDRVYSAAAAPGRRPLVAGTGFEALSFWLLKIDTSNFAYLPTKKMMVRYEIDDNILYVYKLDAKKAEEYLKTTHPTETNIFRDPKHKIWHGKTLSFVSLTPETGKILLELSKKPDLWLLYNQYRKQVE